MIFLLPDRRLWDGALIWVYAIGTWQLDEDGGKCTTGWTDGDGFWSLLGATSGNEAGFDGESWTDGRIWDSNGCDFSADGKCLAYILCNTRSIILPFYPVANSASLLLHVTYYFPNLLSSNHRMGGYMRAAHAKPT